MMADADRRSHERVSRDAPLILLQPGPKTDREGVVLRDVSLGGLAFETSLKLEVGSSFGFALYVPTRGWVDGTGRVCWLKPSGDAWLCGASVKIERTDQSELLGKWLEPSTKGLLRYFFPD